MGGHTNDTRGSDTLGKHSDAWLVGLEGDKDVGGADIVRLGEASDHLVGEERRVVRSEGGVGGDDDALLATELEHVLLSA